MVSSWELQKRTRLPEGRGVVGTVLSGPVCTPHNSVECNCSKTLTAYTVFHSLCVQNKMVEAVGSIKMRQLENFLTNTRKPYKNIFVDHSRVVGFSVET